MGMDGIKPAVLRRLQNLQIVGLTIFLIFPGSHGIIRAHLGSEKNSVSSHTDSLCCQGHGCLSNHIQRFLYKIAAAFPNMGQHGLAGNFISRCYGAEYGEQDRNVFAFCFFKQKLQIGQLPCKAALCKRTGRQLQPVGCFPDRSVSNFGNPSPGDFRIVNRAAKILNRVHTVIHCLNKIHIIRFVEFISLFCQQGRIQVNAWKMGPQGIRQFVRFCSFYSSLDSFTLCHYSTSHVICMYFY